MAAISYQTALSNIQLFNTKKQQEALGNFSNLKAENDQIQEDNETSRAGRFAATFFSLGFCQKYRQENKKKSLEVQKVLNLSFETLLNASTQGLSLEEQVMRETALKTFQATVFTSRSTFLPPPFLAQFYYWVLGVQNLLIKEVKLVFDPRLQNKIHAAENAAKEVQACSLQIEGKQAPLALEDSSSSQALSAPEASKEVMTPLCETQKIFLELVACNVVHEEKMNVKNCGCVSTSAFLANRKLLETAQDEAISENIDVFINLWSQVDLSLVEKAAKAGYIDGQTASKAIANYYDFLKNDKEHAAQYRREAEARMLELAQEASSEFTLGLLGDIANKRMPTMVVEIVELLLANSDLVSDSKTMSKFVFNFLSKKVSAKLEKKYAKTEQQDLKPLIEYQAVMLGLKTFGLNMKAKEIISDLFSKVEGLEEETCADLEFSHAFDTYIQIIEAEQKVNRDMMLKLSKSSSITGEEYFAAAQKVWQKAERLKSIKHLNSPSSSQSLNPLKLLANLGKLEEALVNLPNLDINSLGFKLRPKEIPESQVLAHRFANALLYDMMSFMTKLPSMIQDLEEQAPNRLEGRAPLLIKGDLRSNAV